VHHNIVPETSENTYVWFRQLGDANDLCLDDAAGEKPLSTSFDIEVCGSDLDEVAEITLAIKNATPEQLLALKKADNDYAIQIKELDVRLDEAYISDTQDARHVHSGDQRVFWLGVCVLITFAAVIAGVLYSAHQILLAGLKVADPSTVAVVFTLIGTLVGYVAANAQQVIGYFFGSSKGSSDKTNAMAKAVEEIGQRK